MQLNITTDYAIRVILMLCEPNSRFSASQLSKTLAIPQSYLVKVLARLKNAGLITSALGTNGGYYLNMPAEDITFQLVFDAMDDIVKINRCLEEDHFCSRGATETCPVRVFYEKIQAFLDDCFNTATIVGLTREKESKE